MIVGAGFVVGTRKVSHQNHQHNTQDIFANTRRGLVLPVVAVFIVSVMIISALTAFAVRSLDKVSQEKSVRLAKSVLSDMEQKYMDLSYDYAYWDQAVEHLVITFDPVWANENIGAYLYKTYGVSASYVFNDVNAVIYSAIEGESVDDAPIARFTGGLQTLIAQARTISARDEAPEPIRGFVRDGDRLFFASAARLTTYRTVGDGDLNEATDYVLVLMNEMNAAQLSVLAERYLLHDLRLDLSADAPINATSLAVSDVDGARIGVFHWSTDLPGTEVLGWLLPVVGMLFVAMGGLIFLSIRRATHASHAFIEALSGRHEAELERQLSQVQKMQALGTLVGGVAHNFNNLLQPIMLLAQMIQKRSAENSRDRSDLDVIIQACERAADLVKQISNFTREKDPGEGRNQNIYEVVDQGLKLVASTIPASITVAADLDEDTGMVRINAIETQAVLMNLISNAIDAMDGHVGKLTISLSRALITDRAAELLLDLKGGAYAKLTVSDTGVGMNQKTLKRAFDPFFTTKQVGNGTGLGLSSAYGIVTRHGGSIHASSVVGEGTNFDVYLPLVDKNDPASPNG